MTTDQASMFFEFFTHPNPKCTMISDMIKQAINAGDIGKIAETKGALLKVFFSPDELINFIENNRQRIWDMNNFARGQLIEHFIALTEYKNYEHVGRLFAGYFKTWDFVDRAGKTIISTKTTLALSSKSINNTCYSLMRNIEAMIDVPKDCIGFAKILEIHVPANQIKVANEILVSKLESKMKLKNIKGILINIKVF